MHERGRGRRGEGGRRGDEYRGEVEGEKRGLTYRNNE